MKWTPRQRLVFGLVYLPLILVRLFKVITLVLAEAADWLHYRLYDAAEYVEQFACLIERGARKAGAA